MKRILAMLVVWLVPAMLLAQTTKNVEVKFSEEDFTYEKVGNGYYITSQKWSVSYEANALLPALPYIVVNVLLDSTGEYDGFSFSTEEEMLFEDFQMNRNRMPEPTTMPEDSLRLPEVTLKPISDDVELVRYTGTHLQSGYRYTSFLVSPFRYNAVEKKLYLNKSISISVHQKAAKAKNTSIAYPSGKDAVRRLVANSKDIDSYREYDGITDYEYIIVTCDSLKSTFQRLADWKTMKGVPTKVITTEDIYTQYTGATPQIQIKKALKDYYDGQYHGLRYVLLGGDVDIVPTQMCYVQFERQWSSNYTEYHADITPTDWFFGCLDTMDWNTNGNWYAGELSDSVDIAAELVVSRMPANSNAEARIMVDRVINYERNVSTDGWLDRMLMCGKKMHRMVTWHDGEISDSQYNYEEYFTNLNAGLWDGQFYRLYDTGTDAFNGPDYDFNIEHLQSALRGGFTMANIDTHGGETTLQMEDTLSTGDWVRYTVQNAEELVNRGNTIITTSACHTCAFDYTQSDCLGEAFIKNPQSGILAYIGSSRFGWDPVSFNFDNAFYHILFTCNNYRKKIGDVLFDTKNDMVGRCNSYSMGNRWILFSINMLGDPEMPVYLSEPEKELDGMEIGLDESGGFWIDMETGKYKTCWMSRDDRGASYYNIDWYGGGFYGNEEVDERSFCITHWRYIPYIGVYAPTVHLQNDTVNYDYHVFGHQTLVGRNVTPNRDEGDFVIEKGKTSIVSPQGVTIENGFEVKLGAELEINVGN